MLFQPLHNHKKNTSSNVPSPFFQNDFMELIYFSLSFPPPPPPPPPSVRFGTNFLPEGEKYFSNYFSASDQKQKYDLSSKKTNHARGCF